MPYSITTKDGITINDIPDAVPADSPELKDRVAKIRTQGAPAAPADPERQSLLNSAPMRLAKGGKDGLDGAAQLLQRVLPEGLVKTVNRAADAIGGEGTFAGDVLGIKGQTRPQLDADIKNSDAEYEAARKAGAQNISGLVTGQQPEPGVDMMRFAGNMLSPVNALVPGAGGARTALQVAKAGAKAGAVAGAVQPVIGDTSDFWSTKAGQTAAGAAGGAVVAPIVSKVGEKVAEGVGAVMRRAAAPPTEQQIHIAVNNTFSTQGMNPADVPEAILQSVQRQVDEALRAGRKLNPQEMVRRAQFEAVGLTGDAAPTAAQLSRDPMQFANEKDLSGVRIRTPQGEGNPLADRFSNQQRQLQGVFDRVGARDATDRVTGGQSLIDSLRAADAPVRQGVDDLYTAARGMNGGRAADLERGVFSQNANRALDEGMWGAFVPSEVRALLNNISEGKTPFNVDAAVQIDTLLSKAQRKAQRGGDDAGAAAVGVIRTALHGTPLAGEAAGAQGTARAAADGVEDVASRMVTPTAIPGRPALPAPGAGAPPTGGALGPVIPPAAEAVSEGAAARAAFDQARRAARDRFATIEATPSLRAALDEAAPDKFVQNFILNADARDVQSMRQILANSPEALAQARAQVADHLKRAAFGENASGDKTFAAERYLKTLRAMGRDKLGAFFSPSEIVQLNLAGKVASDIGSIPAGSKPNFSNTGSTVLNLLSRISEAGPLRQIPGVRAIANQVGEIKTERAINQALSPKSVAQPAPDLSPEARRALQFFFTPAGVAGGVLGGSTAR